MPEDPIITALKVRCGSEYDLPGLLACETVVVKEGPRAYKSASILTFGDDSTSEVSKRELRAQTWHRAEGGGYDFEKADNAWHCEDDEIERLTALLLGLARESGNYSLIAADSPLIGMAMLLEQGYVDGHDLAELTSIIAGSPDLIQALAGTDLSTLLEVQRHQDGLARLRAVVEDPSSTEPDIQRVLQEEWWVFGGRFVSPAVRRNILVLDQFDIPLIRADGALHVVEIKQANVPALVEQHRNHLIVGPEIHKATSQTINYLRSLDEAQPHVQTTLGIDCRRSFATVVVGHPAFLTDFTEEEVAETIRTYNSHLSRIEVITYKDLLDGAARALSLMESESGATLEDDDDPF
jgi:hypothetical protein